ncbi:complement C1r subcomponent-like protein isoform X2 [Phascolarctos cinereus]
MLPGLEKISTKIRGLTHAISHITRSCLPWTVASLPLEHSPAQPRASGKAERKVGRLLNVHPATLIINHLFTSLILVFQLSGVCGQPSTPIDQNQGAPGTAKAKLGNFPWQALTIIYGRGGGALLRDRWILTAAHTIYPKDSFFQKNQSVNVFLGHTDIEEIIRLGAHSVRRVIVHPDYRPEEPNNFEGDIALLELEKSVLLSPNLLPICLPDNETLYSSGLMGYVSGFGMERGRLVSQLKYVSLPIAKREACEAWLLEKNRTEVFSSNMFCAGNRTIKQDACQGDSGGVFAVWDNTTERWMATGIVSWGIDCSKGYGFYTKVLSYVDWLKSIMEGKA